jgi:DnaJ-class molecular chaperone
MAERDYYEVLGTSRQATADDIKKAYRSLARKFHPDVNPGDKTAEAKFKEIQQAYDVLSNPEKRSLYDQVGHAAFQGYGSAGPRPQATEWGDQAGGGFESVNINLDDILSGNAHGGGFGGIFEELLGRSRGARSASSSRSRTQSEPSAHAKLTIPFLTAAVGGETSIQIEHEGGTRETLNVRIPPGIETGGKLRIKGRAGKAAGGKPRAPITIEVEVEPHPYFVREGRNLIVEAPVTIAEAVLGGKIEVPTLDGMKLLTVPPGSSSGRKLRLKGRGVPAWKDKPAGDLLVSLKIVVPKSIDETGRELIERFSKLYPENPRQGAW